MFKSFFITMILINIINFINMMLFKIFNYNYKFNFLNSIECGFNNLNNKKIPLSNNFINIMILFIIFDLEISILIPIIISLKFSLLKFNMILILIIIMFMYLSMIYEIKINSIIWMN